METLTLPVNPRDYRFGTRKKPAPKPPKPNGLVRNTTGSWQLRVLVADNNETERRLTIQQLREAWPFERHLLAEGAVDGIEALEKIRRYTYAFVVLDVSLPSLDGRNVLQTLRAERARVPVIVVSAQPRTAIASDLESLAAAFVNKSELDPTRFRNAMAAAMLMSQRVFGLAPVAPIQIRNDFHVLAAGEKFAPRALPSFIRTPAPGAKRVAGWYASRFKAAQLG
jgi:CheY-like chemotaxis protein